MPKKGKKVAMTVEGRGTLPESSRDGAYVITLNAQQTVEQWNTDGRPNWTVRYAVGTGASPDGFFYARTMLPTWINLELVSIPPFDATAIQAGWSHKGKSVWQDVKYRSVKDYSVESNRIRKGRKGRWGGPTLITWDRLATEDTAQSYGLAGDDGKPGPAPRVLAPKQDGPRVEWTEEPAADATQEGG